MKEKIAGLAIFSNLMLAAGKISAEILSNSAAVLTVGPEPEETDKIKPKARKKARKAAMRKNTKGACLARKSNAPSAKFH